jgi:hypothetical protein
MRGEKKEKWRGKGRGKRERMKRVEGRKKEEIEEGREEKGEGKCKRREKREKWRGKRE